MATKNKSSRSKNKKPADKTTKAAASTKLTTKRTSNLLKLRNLNIGLAVVLFAQAVVLLIISKSVSLPVVEHYLAKDTLASQITGQTVWAAAVRHLFDVNLAVVIAITLLLAVIIRALAGGFWAKRFDNDMNAKVNKLRWAEYASAGGLLLLTVALINGIFDVSTLILLFALNLIAALYMFSSEKYKLKLAPWIVNSLAVLATLLPWLIIAQYVKGAIIFGDGLPVYIYVLDSVLFVLYLAGCFNFYKISRAKGKWSNYSYGEKLTMITTLVSYSALVWIVFAGVLS